jgi:hypothetical protein
MASVGVGLNAIALCFFTPTRFLTLPIFFLPQQTRLSLALLFIGLFVLPTLPVIHRGVLKPTGRHSAQG